MNTALLAGDVDVVAGGVPALVILWAKTRGTLQEARGISALKLYRALMTALAEATEILNADKRAAATLWMEDSKSKVPPELVFDVIGGPLVKWTLVPENTMKFASFMYDVGIVKAVPSTWKDLFFSEIQGAGGS